MRFAKAVLFLFVVLFCARAEAQGYRGTDFWICFPENALSESISLDQTLFIASDYRTKGVVEEQGDSAKIEFNVEAGAMISLNIDTTYQLVSSGQIERKSLHVTSEHPITLYVVSHRHASTDSYAAIPTSMLGTEYVVAGYTTNPNHSAPFSLTTQAQIIATADNTMVNVMLTGATRDSQPAGRTISLPMNRGEVFQLQGAATNGDLSGTIVKSTKPIAFVTGHRCAQVPAAIQFCDMLMEMEPPANDWGKDFIATKFQGKSGYVLRVFAREDSTQIEIANIKTRPIAKGECIEIDTLHNDAAIHANKPIFVAQYSMSAQADSEIIGDPFMLVLVPNDRFVTETTTSSISAGSNWDNYVNIVLPDSALPSLQIDGQRLNAVHARAIGKFAVLPRMLTAGSHTISCPTPMAVYSYGFGVLSENYDSYGHTCGMRLDEKIEAK